MLDASAPFPCPFCVNVPLWWGGPFASDLLVDDIKESGWGSSFSGVCSYCCLFCLLLTYVVDKYLFGFLCFECSPGWDELATDITNPA